MPDFEPSNVGNELRRQTGGRYVTHSECTRRQPIERNRPAAVLLPHTHSTLRISYALVLSLRSLATPFLVFYPPRVVVHPLSLLSIRSKGPHRDKE